MPELGLGSVVGRRGDHVWPASREVHPKQFLSLFGARSTFQDTLLRVSDADLFERPVINTNNAYRFMAEEDLDLVYQYFPRLKLRRNSQAGSNRSVGMPNSRISGSMIETRAAVVSVMAIG